MRDAALLRDPFDPDQQATSLLRSPSDYLIFSQVREDRTLVTKPNSGS